MSKDKASNKPWTTTRLRALKGKRNISCLTCYDYPTARIMDRAGVQMLLVGDSLGMTVLGYDSTLPVTMADMLHHTAAVTRGAERALVLADLPFGSIPDPQTALANATRFLKEAGAAAVKLEGGSEQADTVALLVRNAIPVCGHIGLTPQSIHHFGGYKVQGKTDEAAKRLMADAKALEEAGAFALVLEGIPGELGERITKAINIPTIGIGAGNACDGQVLVVQDMLGLFDHFQPRFVRRFADLGSAMEEAFKAYMNAVEDGSFPNEDETY